MSTTYNLKDDQSKDEGLAHAAQVLGQRGLVVMPTDTVFGVAADAFSPQAVATLLASKGRGRHMPPPVLIPRPETMQGLATDVPEGAQTLAEQYWPGALTLILTAQPSLTWDLGETRGTVALRMPDHKDALALLAQTGPLAVSSANRSGLPAAMSAQEAQSMLGESVAVYLEAHSTNTEDEHSEHVDRGEQSEQSQQPEQPEQSASQSSSSVGVAAPSTIVDYTLNPPRIVRVGALSLEQLREADPTIVGLDTVEAEETSEPTPGPEDPEAGENTQP